ncbi:MAG: hypothetical protein HY720_14405 [Planctomycetes bacterium]|nr:hypothetical protein [Planctomycetota bacterium]
MIPLARLVVLATAASLLLLLGLATLRDADPPQDGSLDPGESETPATSVAGPRPEEGDPSARSAASFDPCPPGQVVERIERCGGSSGGVGEPPAVRSGGVSVLESPEEVELRSAQALQSDADDESRIGAIGNLLALATRASLSEETWAALERARESDPQGGVRAGALWLVAARRPPLSRDALLVLALEADPSALVRETAAEGLGAFGGGALPASAQSRILEDLERESEEAVRRMLLLSLVRRGLGDPGTAFETLGYLVDRDPADPVRPEYLAAAVAFGGQDARSRLDRWLEDPELAADARTYLDLLDGELASTTPP